MVSMNVKTTTANPRRNSIKKVDRDCTIEVPMYITMKRIDRMDPMSKPRQPAHQVLLFMVILWVWNLSQSG
jgi:hypothetical protein